MKFCDTNYSVWHKKDNFCRMKLEIVRADMRLLSLSIHQTFACKNKHTLHTVMVHIWLICGRPQQPIDNLYTGNSATSSLRLTKSSTTYFYIFCSVLPPVGQKRHCSPCILQRNFKVSKHQGTERSSLLESRAVNVEVFSQFTITMLRFYLQNIFFFSLIEFMHSF